MSEVTLLLLLWTVQQSANIRQSFRPAVTWTHLCTTTEMRRAWRVAQEIRQDRGRIDDSVWAVRRAYALCVLFSVAMIVWSVMQAVFSLHSILWAVPTLIMIAWFWGNVAGQTRGLVDQLYERKRWITGKEWADDAGEDGLE